MFWRSLSVQKPLAILLCAASLLPLASASASAAGYVAVADTAARHGFSEPSVGDVHLFRTSSLSTGQDPHVSLYSSTQRLAMQVLACVLGGFSFIGSIVVFYWFLRMKRIFRHQLIIMLIFANIIRSMWYFIFPLVAFSHGQLSSRTSFCQASGFFTQLGVEMADFSILFIAIHTALQVFRPKPPELGQSGLYPYRFYVFAASLALPIISASLPFVRGTLDAYAYQGPTCNLPIRPYWYRLGLSWIPRYIIMLTILALYIAIYVHAGLAMSMGHPTLTLARLRSNTSRKSRKANREIPLQPTTRSPSREKTRRPSTPDPEHGQMEDHERPWSAGVSPMSSPGPLTMQSLSEHGTLVGNEPPTRKDSDLYTGSLSSTAYIQGQDHVAHNHATGSICTDTKGSIAGLPSGDAKQTNQTVSAPPRPSFGLRRQSSPFGTPPALETIEMRRRRDSIRRHLRLLFVYPLVYFAVWIIPFVMNILNYDDYYAQHPVFPITLLSYIAVASMGIIDSMVFALREKPWRHIPGSDGTFRGSFTCWGQSFWGSNAANRGSVGYSSNDISPDSTAAATIGSPPGSPMRGRFGSDAFQHLSADYPGTNTAPQGATDGVGNWDFAAAGSAPAALPPPAAPVKAAEKPTRPAHVRTKSREWFDDL